MHVFYCVYLEVFQNSFLAKQLRETASVCAGGS